MIEWFLIGLMWCFGLTALACAVALCLSYRRPRPYEPAVPEYALPEPNIPQGGGRMKVLRVPDLYLVGDVLHLENGAFSGVDGIEGRGMGLDFVWDPEGFVGEMLIAIALDGAEEER